MKQEFKQREIKFRAWDKGENKWLLHYDSLGGFSLMGECVLFGEWAAALPRMERWDDVVIMQFTGLHDKNRKEIYEYDVDSHGRYIEYRDGAFHVVQSNGQTFDYLSHMKHIEIAGNIFQNPNLLNHGNTNT